jgi:hypothetical protein
MLHGHSSDLVTDGEKERRRERGFITEDDET